MAADIEGAIAALRDFEKEGLLRWALPAGAIYPGELSSFRISLHMRPSAKATEADIKRIKEKLETFDLPVDVHTDTMDD